MIKKSVVERIRSNIPSGTIEGIAMISDRAAVVKEVSENSVDVFFDNTDYVAKNLSYCSTFKKNTHLEILSGALRAPGIKKYEDALKFAKEQLTPLNDWANWYESPIEIKLR